MSTNIVPMAEARPMDTTALEKLVMEGDLSQLTAAQRLTYYQQVCTSLGINPLTRPFDYLRLNGKLTLYAKRDAADQLRKLRGVSVNITSQETVGDIYIVTVTARDATGREDSDIGAVSVKGLGGEALANAMLKAVTKAKRRVTLSICGLGWLDETETSSIPGAQPVIVSDTGEIIDAEPAEDPRLPKLRGKWERLQADGREVGLDVPAMPEDYEAAYNAAIDWHARIETERADRSAMLPHEG